MPLVAVPTLSDGVVTLRAHTDDDVDAVVEQCRDPLSVEWTTVPTGYTREDARRFVRDVMPGGWASDQEWGFAVATTLDGVADAFAGTVSLRNLGQRRAEVAFGAHPAARGTGTMERALRLLLAWGFSPEGRDLGTVAWYAYPGNWASRRLAWKVGFRVEGTLRGWVDHRGELVDVWAGTLRSSDLQEPPTPWLDAPTIELASGRLRPLRADDDPRIVEACRDEEQAYWIGSIPRPFGEQDARAWREDRTEAAASATAVTWAVADGDDRLVGAVNVFGLGVRPGEGELGFWVHPDARGRGTATAAARAAARHALVAAEDGGLGLERLRLTAAVDNEASRRVAESVGFHLVGVERRATLCRDGRHDTAVHDLLPEDLQAR
jgi:RimJ/RimL family protein N-acetyltransferase